MSTEHAWMGRQQNIVCLRPIAMTETSCRTVEEQTLEGQSLHGTRSPEAASDMRRVAIISWETHRRTQELAKALDFPLYELCDRRSGLARYIALCYRTIKLLTRVRPDVLIVQNPSIVLAGLSELLRPLIRYELVVDAHNEAVRPYINQTWPVPAIARWLLRRASITIVTNDALAKTVCDAGGRPHVLPDRLPEAPTAPLPPRDSPTPFSVLVIATYAPDEPIDQILEAAKELGTDYQFHFTGNYLKLPESKRTQLPSNVALTGFLPEQQYWTLMRDCDVVLDLTLMEDCLVCGAYEALSLHKPMILSESTAARNLFGGACLLTKPNPESIAGAIRAARSMYTELSSRAPLVAARFVREWDLRAETLVRRMKVADTADI
jgi:glycosyltransferase involved in cell wall biosynthesis